jgi:integrase/recombinase XerD
MEKHISFNMLHWTSALIDLSNGVEKDKIRQKLGFSKVHWREVSNKLHSLAEENGYPIPEETAEGEAAQ